MQFRKVTTSYEAMRQYGEHLSDLADCDPALSVYPDKPAPNVRNGCESRELAVAALAYPASPSILKGKPDTGVMNIHNFASPLTADPVRKEIVSCRGLSF